MMNFLNHPDLVGFYALAAVAIFASLRVITHANPVHAILAMIVSLLAVAGIFFILGAPFAGALEIIVYAGAILVLFVFVIMMLNLGMVTDAREELWLDANTWAVPTGLTVIIAVVLYAMIGLNHDEAAMIGGTTVSAKAVGSVLFTKYMMLVEVAALLLLGALVAAYHLGKPTLEDNLIDNNHKDMTPNSSRLKNNDNNVKGTSVEAPYEYKDVDPHDYVGMNKVTRKELD